MTDSKLVTSLPQGSGFTHRLAAKVYADMATDKTPEQIVVIGILEPVGYGQRRTANGIKQHVQFEAVKLEPVMDAGNADDVRHMIQAAYDARHSVQTLPLDFPGQDVTEQRRTLLTFIDEWATEEGMTGTDVGERWRTHFGIEADTKDTPPGWAHPDYRHAAPNHLREFALTVGAVAEDGKPGDDADDNVAGTPEDDELANGEDNVTPIDGKAAAAGPDR